MSYVISPMQTIAGRGPLRAMLALFLALFVMACASDGPDVSSADLYPNETPELRRIIVHYANLYEVPVDLVQRVIRRESTHRPEARNGPYWGLMQIHPTTARTMGHDGPPETLLDPATNLRYAVRYLRGAWIVANGDQDAAVMWYARGYYYEARNRGLLRETGLR